MKKAKLFTRALPLLMVVSMLMGLLPSIAFAEQSETGDAVIISEEAVVQREEATVTEEQGEEAVTEETEGLLLVQDEETDGVSATSETSELAASTEEYEEQPSTLVTVQAAIEAYDLEADAITTREELQAAVDDAEEGAVIVISQDIEFDSTPITVPADADVTIRSENGSAFTLTQSSALIRHFVVAKKGALTLENIVLDGGSAGGGVQVTSGGIFAMGTGAIIQNCSAKNGGGIYAAASSSVTISGNSEIRDNTVSQYGGGIYVLTNSFHISDYVIISGNVGSYGGGGIAVSGSGSNVSVDKNVVISGNTAGFGGGIYVYSNGTAEISGDVRIGGEASVDANTAQYGGGIAITYGGEITIDGNVTILGNMAAEDGGGAYLFGCVVGVTMLGVLYETVYDAVITMNGGELCGNTADGLGGGVYVSSATYSGKILGTFQLNGGKISNNTAKDGGGIYTTDYSNLTTSGTTVFSGNTASALYEPQEAAATAYPRIQFAGTSVSGVFTADHPVNNYDVNYDTSLDGSIYYSVSYDANGGEGSIAGRFIQAGAFSISDGTEFTRDGYILTGWTDGDGTSYATGATITISENMIFTAKWERLYTLTVQAETGGTVTTANGNYPEGEVITITSSANSGYSFSGWVSDNGGTFASSSSASTTFTMPAGDTTITASFTDSSNADDDSDKTTNESTSGSTGGSSGGSTSGKATGGTTTDSTSINIEDEATPLGALETSVHLKYLTGYPDGTVRADNAITRAEAANIFYKLLKETYKNGNATSNFTDVTSDAWYSLAVSTLADMGIITGYSDGTFRPNDPITRAEFSAMSTRFDELSASVEENIFSDVDSSHWAVGYINIAYNNGWVNGYEDGTFKPEKSITRAEVVKIVNTMLNRLPASIEAANPYSDITSSHWAYIHILEASIDHDYTTDTNGTEVW